MLDRWRLDYNHRRTQSSLDYQTPAAYATGCVIPASATPQPQEHNRKTNPNPFAQLGAKTGGVVSGGAHSKRIPGTDSVFQVPFPRSLKPSINSCTENGTRHLLLILFMFNDGYRKEDRYQFRHEHLAAANSALCF